MATPQPFKIAILGTGPAGLTLASLLSKHLSSHPTTSLSLMIFELRPKPSPEDLQKPSGSLDLHAESGQLALDKLGLLQEFLDTERVCSEALLICDKEGVVGHGDSGEGSRPECSRGWLMDVLLSGVPQDTIRWGSKVLSVEAAEKEGKWVVSSSKGDQEESEEFDFVIGADGAHSKTRKAVTEQELVYSTVNCLILTIPSISSKYPGLAKRVGAGSYWSLSKGKAVMCQRGSFGSARIYLMIHSDDAGYLTTSGLEGLVRDAEGLKSKLLSEESLFGGYGEEVKELVRVGCDEEGTRMKDDEEEISIKRLYMLPVGHRWEHKKGVSLIGDAAHLMTPFAGEGVNLGMLDGLELSEAIIQGLEKGGIDAGAAGGLDRGVRAFEEKMWKRSEEVAGETWRNLEMFFRDEEAPRGWVEFFKSFDLPPIVDEEASGRMAEVK